MRAEIGELIIEAIIGIPIRAVYMMMKIDNHFDFSGRECAAAETEIAL
jgi:hypothetical protein